MTEELTGVPKAYFSPKVRFDISAGEGLLSSYDFDVLKSGLQDLYDKGHRRTNTTVGGEMVRNTEAEIVDRVMSGRHIG